MARCRLRRVAEAYSPECVEGVKYSAVVAPTSQSCYLVCKGSGRERVGKEGERKHGERWTVF